MLAEKAFEGLSEEVEFVKRPRLSKTFAVSEAIVLLVTFSVVITVRVEMWSMSFFTSQQTTRALGVASGAGSTKSFVSMNSEEIKDLAHYTNFSTSASSTVSALEKSLRVWPLLPRDEYMSECPQVGAEPG